MASTTSGYFCSSCLMFYYRAAFIHAGTVHPEQFGHLWLKAHYPASVQGIHYNAMAPDGMCHVGPRGWWLAMPESSTVAELKRDWLRHVMETMLYPPPHAISLDTVRRFRLQLQACWKIDPAMLSSLHYWILTQWLSAAAEKEKGKELSATTTAYPYTALTVDTMHDPLIVMMTDAITKSHSYEMSAVGVRFRQAMRAQQYDVADTTLREAISIIEDENDGDSDAVNSDDDSAGVILSPSADTSERTSVFYDPLQAYRTSKHEHDTNASDHHTGADEHNTTRWCYAQLLRMVCINILSRAEKEKRDILTLLTAHSIYLDAPAIMQPLFTPMMGFTCVWMEMIARYYGSSAMLDILKHVHAAQAAKHPALFVCRCPPTIASVSTNIVVTEL
jgi:hypothetical protein